MIWIVTCCDPRDPSTLVRKLRLGGAEHIFEVWDRPRRGNFFCTLQALQLAADLGRPATIFQDDAIVPINLPRYIQATWKEMTTVSWFEQHATYHRGQPDKRFWLTHGSSFRFPIAVSYPPSAARTFADYMESHAPTGPGLHHDDEQYIAEAMTRAGLYYFEHSPSMVQHGSGTGHYTSLVAPNEPSRGIVSSFVGAHFDALEMLP